MAFQKGQSGNPNGRPRKGNALSELIRKQLQEPAEAADGKTNAQVIAEKLVTLASAGDIDALKILLDRTEGKVPDTTNLNTSGTLKVKVVYERTNAKASGPASQPAEGGD